VSTTYSSRRSGGVTLTGVGAIALAFVIALAGAGVDLVTGPGLRRVFAISLVIGAVVAILLVRVKDAYAVAVSPPLIYMTISVLAGIAHSSTVFGSKRLFGAQLVSWLVYGFPEMALATALAVVIAVSRYLMSRQ
jgi:exosortase/archaeosortase